MAEYLDLGKVLDPEKFTAWINRTEQFENFVHVYGSDFKIPDYPCWMEYQGEGGLDGSISFTRNTIKDPVLIGMVDELYDIFLGFFPPSIKPNRERIHLIKTRGCIPVHRDEANRLSCINIGLKNSQSALTHISTDGIYENFNSSHATFRVAPGHAYLLNTAQWHSVESPKDVVRYLVTYGFGVPFSTLKQPFSAMIENR